MTTTRLIRWAFIAIAFWLGTNPVMAQSGYPDWLDPYINDYASLLTTEHAASLRSLFSELKSDNGVEIVVVTIDSINDYTTGADSVKSFATNLFNTWGIGDAQKNDGVLLLVAVNDRAVRIEVGAGYGDKLNAEMQAIIDEQIIRAGVRRGRRPEAACRPDHGNPQLLDALSTTIASSSSKGCRN